MSTTEELKQIAADERLPEAEREAAREALRQMLVETGADSDLQLVHGAVRELAIELLRTTGVTQISDLDHEVVWHFCRSKDWGENTQPLWALWCFLALPLAGRGKA